MALLRNIYFYIFIILTLIGCNNHHLLTISMTPLKRGTVMDPTRIYFLNEYYLIENLTVRLVEIDAQVGYKLMLASEISKPNDREVHIKIKDAYFSSGEKISLTDVKNTLDRARKNINSQVPLKEIIHEISISGDTLKIFLKKKVNDFLYFLTLADLSILHSSQAEKKEILIEDWEKVSSGPFKYVIEGEDIFLVKNPHYKLSSSNYPDKIKLLSSKSRDSFVDFKEDKIDFGEFNLNSYEKHLTSLSTQKNLQVIGNTGDMINFFTLNANHPKFKSEYNRRWVLKKILLNFKLDSKYNPIAKKALQFFTPYVKGFLDEKEILKEINSWTDIDTNIIPPELKNGFTVSTYIRAFEVSVKGAFDSLSDILGIPVTIENNVSPLEIEKFINKREFEVFLGITSMDQIVVGESINLYYFSSSPHFKDVNGKIKVLMNEYQTTDLSKTPEVVNRIALQMTKDAECVPLFYVASPFFFNKEKVDVSALDEMTYFNLWKIKPL